MKKLIGAYIYKMDGVNCLVVTDKSVIANGEEKDFEEITLVLTDDTIRELYEEIQNVVVYENNERE